MKKTHQWIGIVITSALLSACHENPLKTQSKTSSTDFLVRASAFAERAMKLGIPEGSLGGVYTDCMEHKSGAIDCEKIYQGMLSFAKSGKNPAFKNLTFTDLTDKEVFEVLRDRYEETLLTIELKD